MTVSPGTPVPPASVTVAVTVLSERPSARIDAGDSATVTFAGGPAANDAPPQHRNVASSASTPTINNRARAINRRPGKRLPPQCLVSRNPPHHPRPARLRPTGGHYNPTAPNRPRTIRMSRPNRHLARGNEGHGASQPSLSAPAPGSPATRISGPCCARGESVAGAAGGPATGTTTASMLDRWPTGAASTVRSTQWAETGDDPCPERGRDCPSVAPAAVSIPPLLLAERKPGDHRWPVRSPRSLRRRCAGHARRSSRADALAGSAPSLGRRSCAWSPMRSCA